MSNVLCRSQSYARRVSAAIALVFLPLLSIVAAEPGTRERAFVRALELFDAKEYRESAKLLESIVTDGFQNGAVYYNLGNAYYRAGEFGRAILNYRKAQTYRPRDPYLKANLQQAIAAAPGKLRDSPTPWWKHVLFWSDWISLPSKVKLLGLVLCATAVIAFGAVYRQARILTWLAVGGLVLSSIIGLDLAIQYRDVVSTKLGVITGQTIARKGVGESYEAAFDRSLLDGAEFIILRETSDWTLGHFEGIGDGWVQNDFVAR